MQGQSNLESDGMSQALDPDMAKLLAAMRAAPATDYRTMPIDTARATFEAVQTPWAWCPFPLASTQDLTVPGGAGPIRARLYRPDAKGDLPVVLFAHGGGWTFGSVDTHGGTMQWLAATSGCAVLGIDYRLAPEHPFPAGHDDVMAAIAHIRAGGLGAGIDPQRIALAGDSAGANLALGALLALRDAGLPMPQTAALFYGCYAPIFDTDSNTANGDGSFVLSTEMMRWYWANFLGGTKAEDAPAACAPLFADLAGLPPLYLNAAGLDPLLDDTLILSRRLAAQGIRHRLDIWPGVIHGFLRLARELPTAQSALVAAGEHLAATFAGTTRLS